MDSYLIKQACRSNMKKRLKRGKDDSQLDRVVLEINSTDIKEFAPSGLFPATDP